MSRSERIDFPSRSGDRLAAQLDRPDGTPRAFALFAHCFTCSKDLPATSRIARGLARRGIAVLRFDFTGLGHSEGEFANSNFSSNLEDLAAQRLEPAIANLRRALLVLHAPRDEIVGIENASRIFQAAKHPKSFVSLDSADHLLRNPADAAYAADVLAVWASRYLPEGAAETAGSAE